MGVVSVTTSIKAPVGDGFAGRAPSPQLYSGEAHRALSGNDVPPSGWASLTISAAVIHQLAVPGKLQEPSFPEHGGQDRLPIFPVNGGPYHRE